jgi:hypothetical protein
MPVTLMLLYRAMPNNPGFSFGLAASMLFPGLLAGNLLNGIGHQSFMTPVLFLIFALNAGILSFVLIHSRPKKKVGDFA